MRKHSRNTSKYTARSILIGSTTVVMLTCGTALGNNTPSLSTDNVDTISSTEYVAETAYESSLAIDSTVSSSALQAGVTAYLTEMRKSLYATTGDLPNIENVSDVRPIEKESYLEPEETETTRSSETEETSEESDVVEIEVKDDWDIGYATTSVNIRKRPSTDADVLSNLSFNEKVEYQEYNSDWYLVRYDDDVAFVSTKYISDSEMSYKSYTLSSSGFKSYMPYTAITSKSSSQYKLQAQFAYTGTYGIRQVNGRYCVALGSTVAYPIGTYADLVLENGTIIPCILADQKADKDTKSDNLTTASNGCVSEFVVDSSALVKRIKRSGSVSSACDEWDSPVVEIRVYGDMNVFN